MLYNGYKQRDFCMTVSFTMGTYNTSPNSSEPRAACAICLVDFPEGAPTLGHDQHHFDPACIMKWLGQNPTCPTCRAHATLTPEAAEVLQVDVAEHDFHRLEEPRELPRISLRVRATLAMLAFGIGIGVPIAVVFTRG